VGLAETIAETKRESGGILKPLPLVSA
jgi:hypothetical protein